MVAGPDMPNGVDHLEYSGVHTAAIALLFAIHVGACGHIVFHKDRRRRAGVSTSPSPPLLAC